MQYFRLLDDVHVPGRWHLGELTAEDGAVLDPLSVKAFPSSARISISHAGKPLDFCLTSFAVPVARLELSKAIISVAGGDVQQVPVIIDGDSRFVVLHVRRFVACLDEERSEFIKWTKRDHRADLAGQYRMVTQLHVDAQRIPKSIHVFRISGWPIALIVSEVVKHVMEANGCIGAKFDVLS